MSCNKIQSDKMNKATTKDGLPKQAKRYNTSVINSIASKRNLTKDFVRKCVNGSRHSETAEEIRAEYKKLSFQVTEVLIG